MTEQRHKASPIERDRRTYYAEAARAIRAGILTPTERDAVCRPGTRKAGYFSRHLLTLRELVDERQHVPATEKA